MTVRMCYLDEVGELGVALGDELVHFDLQLPLLLVLEGRVVFGEAGLALSVLQQEEVNHGGGTCEETGEEGNSR